MQYLLLRPCIPKIASGMTPLRANGQDFMQSLNPHLHHQPRLGWHSRPHLILSFHHDDCQNHQEGEVRGVVQEIQGVRGM